MFTFEDVRFIVREIGNDVAIAVDATLAPTAVAWTTSPIAWREKRPSAIARALVNVHFERERQRKRARIVERAAAFAEAAAAAAHAEARRSTPSTDDSEFERVAIAG